MKRNHVLWNVFVLTVAVLFGSVATSVAGVIGGMITYNGVYADSSAPLKVAAFEKQGDTMPVCAMDLGSVKTAIQTNGGVYTLNYPSLVSGNTYFIEAFIDCLSPVTTGYAISKTKEEPSGWSSIAVASETVQSNVIFAISDKTAFLDGAYAYYTGTAYEGKPLLMGVQDIERTSEYFWSSSSTILVSGTTQYQFPDITNIIMGRTYKVKAFVDADNDGAYDEGEPFGDILTNYNVMADTVTIGDVAVNDMLTGFITGTLSYNPPIYSDHQVIIGITPLIPTEIDLGNTSNYAKFVTTTTSYPYNYSLNLAGISTTNYTLVAVIVGQGNKVLAKDYSVRSTYTQWTNLAGKNLAMTNQRGKIMGVISYPGSKAGNMYIGAFDSSNSTTPVNTVAVGRTTETSCAYQLDTLDFNTDYWIRAYVDCFIPNGSFDVGRTTDEPTGFYTDTNGSLSPINISSTSIMYSSINVEVKDVIGSISGTIGYNGNFTSGNIYVGAFDLSISSESPCAIVGAGSISAGTTQYAYSIGGLTSGNTFFMKAYLDSVEPFGDMSPSNGEASGQLGGDYPQSVVLINDITAGANFEIRDPEPGSISGMLYYNNPIFAGRQVLIGISSNPITGSPMDPSNYAAYITLTPSPTDYPCSFNLSLTGIPTTNYMLIALIMGQDYKIIAATSTMHTLTQWSKIGEGLSIENKRGILGGTMQYSGLRSGNIHVGAFASAEALTPVSYTVIDVNKISGTAIQYEIDTVDFGMNYWVRAYIDCFIPQGGGYDVGFTSNEPQGVFRDTSGNISPAACSVSVPKMMGVDFPIKDQVGTISGNIIYNGVRSTGTLYVGLWDVAISSQGQGAPQMFINAGMLSTGRSTYSYTFDLVPIGHTYLIQAYVDCDAPFGDLSPTSGEPSGRTTDPVFLSSYQSGTIDFAVIDSAPGYLAGTVNYTGGVYLLQPVTIALGHGKPGPTWGDAGNVVAYSTGISVATNGWPYSFNVPIGTIPDATDYYLAIMIDVNPEQNTGPEAYVDLGPLSLTKYSVHTDLALNMVNVSLPITGSLTYSGSSSMLYKPVKISLGYGEYGTVGYNEVAFTTTIVVSSQEYYFNVHMDSSYYVNAIVDMNSNGMYGDVGDLMQRIGPINNFDLSNNNNIALVGPIAGNGSISYYGNYTGKNMLISAGIRKPGASFTPSTSTIAMSSYGYSYYNFDLPVHTDVLVTAIIDVNNNGIFNPAEGDSYGEIGPIDTTSGSANLPTLYINDQGGYINPNLKYEGIYGDKNIVGMVGYGPYSTGWVPVVMSSQSMVMTEPTGGTQYKRTDFYFNFTLSKNATNYFVVGFVDLNGDLQFQANEPFGQFGPVEVPGSNNYPNVEVMDNLGGTGKINGSINYSGSYTSYQLYVELYSGDPSNILQAQKLAVKKMYPMSYPVSYSFGTLPNSVSYFVRAGIDVTYNGSVDSDEPIGKRGPIAVSATNSPIADIILSTGTLGEGYINGQVYYNGEEFRDKPVFINLWNGLPSLTTSKVIRKTVITPYNWPIYYSFSMVQAYSGYYVTAGIDANNDGVVNAVVEPFIRRDQPITIGSTSETNNVSGIDMTIPYKSATGYSGSISVNYSYNSPSPKQGMYRAYLGHGQPGPNWTPVRIATNTLQYGSFYWAGVPDAEDWAVFIGVDVDNSGQVSPDTEPFGMIYPISVSSGSAQNVYVEVRDPMTMTNAIEGNVYYSGVQSGRTYVEVGKVSDTSYTRYAWIDGSYFSFVSLDGDCTYYIKGYKDSNNDYMRDGTDPSTGYNNEYLVFVPMNGKATQMISMADPVGMESGTVDIKVSYGFKSISQGVVHVQFSKYDSANPAAYFSPISRDASFVSTNTATLNTSLQVGTYKVGAYWDKDNDYMYENFEEPWGDAAQMVTVSTSEVKYMDITLKDPVVSGVEGNVSYTNAPTNFLGQLVIRVVEAQSQSIVNRLKFVPSPTIQLTFPKFYQISNITPNTTYFIVAYHDINMSNSIDPGEPVSKRQVFIAESMVTVNHTIALDTTNIATGGISGKVKYTGTNTMNANVLIYVWENAVGGPTTLGSFVINNFEMGEATYTIYGLADKSNYYVAAFKDMSNDTQQQSYEPSGEALNPITVTGGRVTAGKDITLVDFVSGDSSMQTSTYTINMMIREGEWGMTTGGSSGLSGVSVQIIDTYSDYNSDNDKVIAYGVTGIVKGTGSNLDPYRNIEFSGVVLKISTDTYNPYRYNVRLAKEGYIASGMDVFVDQYSNAVVNRDGYLQKRMYVVSVSSISVDTGTDDGISVKAIISPDGDNVNDRAYIRFTYTNTYQGSQSWQKGGSAKITVDTNRDGIFNAFDWRQIVWQMDPANPTGPQVPYKDGVKMTYEDLNRMQAGFDWAMDTWIDQDQFMLGASTQMADSVRKEIMWEGRNTQGQSMPAGVYPVKIELDSPNWDPSDGMVLSDTTTLSIEIKSAGISGYVKYDVKGTTDTADDLPVEGARVSAGGAGCWGEAYTDTNGFYTVGGLKATTATEKAWASVQAKGYTSSEVEDITITADTITPDINFSLQKGATVKGQIVLPAAVDSWYDQFGNRRNGISGTVTASKRGSYSSNFTGFYLQNQVTTYYEITLSPGDYEIYAHAEGEMYTSKRTTLTITSSDVELNINLVPAIKVMGYVKLPATSEGNNYINVGGQRKDGQVSVNGWGNIMPGNTTGYFQVYGVVADPTPGKADSTDDNTYSIRVQVSGYAEKTFDLIIGTESMTIPDMVEVEKGGMMIGKVFADWTPELYEAYKGQKLVMHGRVSSADTGFLQQSSNEGPGAMYIEPATFTVRLILMGEDSLKYLDMVNTSTTIPQGMSLSDYEMIKLMNEYSYAISGMANGKYKLEIWTDIIFNAEPKYVEAVVNGTTTVIMQTITLKQFSGKIQGVVTASTGTVDYSKVRVMAYMPYWEEKGIKARMAEVSTTGYFSIDGLGLGEYIVVANEYSVPPSTTNPKGELSGNFGTVLSRINVPSEDTLSLVLPTGGKISGAVSIKSSKYTAANLVNQKVYAVPLLAERTGTKVTPFETVITSSDGVYAISGLKEEVYRVFIDPDIDVTNDSGTMKTPDVAMIPQMVSLAAGEQKTGINFVLTDGHKITGSVQRPVAGTAESFIVTLFLASTNEEVAFKRLDFTGTNTSARTLPFEFANITSGKYVIRIKSTDISYK
ncbi:MAG: carboxypeptidase-like regulatory domain-containing protein, partial [Elusimicrobiota bacterium]